MSAVIYALLGVTAGSGIVWAATMLFRRAFRGRLSAGMQTAIWSVFLVRLLLPVSFEVSLPRPSWIPDPAPSVSTAPASVPDDGPAAETKETAAPMEPAPRPAEATSAAPGGENLAAAEPAEGFEWENLCVLLWLAGVGVSAAASARAYLRLRRELRSRSAPRPSWVERLFQECRRDVGAGPGARLSVQAAAGGPALVFPNVVILPGKLLTCDPEGIEMALRHELTHYRRGDHLLSFLLCVLRTVYWFNPFAWLAARTIREDLETACDRDVLRRLGPARRPAYARSVLAMYRNCAEPRAALGMAAGSARRDAEKRIKGMYLPERSGRAARAASIALACLLAATCFTTGCQPTPEREAVAARRNVEEATGEGAVSDGPHYMPAAYVPTGRWEESFERDGVTIAADIDVLEPTVDAYGTQKLEEAELTQEIVDRLVAALAGEGASFTQLPLPRSRESLEEDLLELREARSLAEASGQPAEQLSAFDEWIANAEEEIRNAPADVDAKPADARFTYERDSSGNALDGGAEDYIDIGVEGERPAVIHATRSRATAMTGPSFDYSAYAWAWTEQGARQTLSESEAADDSRTAGAARSALDVMDGYRTDAAAQEERAAALLEELGVEGVQITFCGKAAFAPLSDARDAGILPRDARFLPGTWIEFAREAGGVPCADQARGLSSEYAPEASGSASYRPPFMPEQGSILLDADGNVVRFVWRDMSKPVSGSLTPADILPFEDVKDRVIDQLYYAAKGVYSDEWSVEIIPEEASLVSAYVGAYEDPDAAMIVPAWRVKVTGLAETEGEESHEMEWPDIFLNAVDGTPILLPPLEGADYQ